MRDVTTSVAAFLILAVLATGIYLAIQKYHQVNAAASAIALPDVDTVEDLVNSLLGGGSTPAPPPPTPSGAAKHQTTPTPPPATPSPTVTHQAPRTAATPPATEEPTPTLAPPPTPVAPPTPTPAATAAVTRRFPFALQGPVRHDNECPGQYIMGVVRDTRGNPLAGVTVRMEDEYGNSATQVSKSTPGEVGRYDFVLTGVPRRIYVWIVDEGGNPISPRVEILHLLPNSGYEAFTCHYVDWQRTQ